MHTLLTFILLIASLLIGNVVVAEEVDFRTLKPQAFGMLITPLEGDNKRVVYVSERKDLALAKFLVVTNRTEAFIYCYATYTDIPKTDRFVALQGNNLEYVVELKEGLLTNCWLSNKHLF